MSTIENPGLGLLGKLPREIRDEIYRHLVKVSHQFLRPYTDGIPTDGPLEKEIKQRKLDTTILRLSKAIKHEAMTMYLSESTFVGHIDTVKCVGILSKPQLDRIKKIELYVVVGSSEVYRVAGFLQAYFDRRYGWRTMMKKVCVTDRIRKSILVAFKIICSPICTTLSEDMLQNLRLLVNYRTVVISLTPVPRCTDSPNSSDSRMQELETYTEDVKHSLKPTLGTATTSLTSELKIDRQIIWTSRLEFHPQDFIAKKLNDNAKSLALEDGK